MTLGHFACCGLREVIGLSTDGWPPAEKLWRLCRTESPSLPQFLHRCRYLVFTQAGRGVTAGVGYGYEFAEFIRSAGLGTVIDTIPAGVNPNSSNDLKMFVWIVDLPAMQEWVANEVKTRNYVHTPPPVIVADTSDTARPQRVVRDLTPDIDLEAPAFPVRPAAGLNVGAAMAEALREQARAAGRVVVRPDQYVEDDIPTLARNVYNQFRGRG